MNDASLPRVPFDREIRPFQQLGFGIPRRESQNLSSLAVVRLLNAQYGQANLNVVRALVATGQCIQLGAIVTLADELDIPNHSWKIKLRECARTEMFCIASESDNVKAMHALLAHGEFSQQLLSNCLTAAINNLASGAVTLLAKRGARPQAGGLIERVPPQMTQLLASLGISIDDKHCIPMPPRPLKDLSERMDNMKEVVSTEQQQQQQSVNNEQEQDSQHELRLALMLPAALRSIADSNPALNRPIFGSA